MKKFAVLSLFVCSLMIAVPGCGGGTGPTNVTEGVEQSELEKYEEMIAEDAAEEAAAMEAGFDDE